MLKLAALFLIGLVLAEANITKRAVKQAHVAKFKRGGDRVGMQPGDTDLCPFMDILGDRAAVCDEDTVYGIYCILTDWECDGEQDCHDGSDERKCRKNGRKKHRKQRKQQ